MTSSGSIIVDRQWHRPGRDAKDLAGMTLSAAGLTGLVIVGLFALIALGVWAGFLGQGWAEAAGDRWESPGATHWFGTNLLGQDIFERTVFSIRVAFELGLAVAVLTGLLGALTGAVSGWYADTWVDELIVLLTGVIDSIPFYLFVAAVAYAMRGNNWAIQLAMVVTFWTTTSRLVRAEVMRLKNRDFVLATRAIGLPVSTIITRHILPNTYHVLLAQSAIVFVAAIKAEVVLSFLGLGPQDGVSWGLMLAESTQEVLAGQFGNLLAASIPLFLLILGLNLVTDSFQDAFDPRQGTA